MFGRKREIYEDIDTDWIRLSSSHPEIANAIMAKEELEKENLSLKNQIARLKEQLSNADRPSILATEDPAIAETVRERDRLEKENLELKQKLDGFRQAAAAPFDDETETKMRAELEELKNRIKSEASRSKSLSDALNEEREELARIKENYRRTDMAEKDDITQWEYKVVEEGIFHNDRFFNELNKLGEAGWEMQGIVCANSPAERVVFKRPKQDIKKSKTQDYGYGR